MQTTKTSKTSKKSNPGVAIIGCGLIGRKRARALGPARLVVCVDPVVKSLPPELSGKIHLVATARDALVGAEALVVATEWPEYPTMDAATLVSTMKNPTVLDASRFLASTLGVDSRIRYMTVGKPVYYAIR